MTGLFPTENSYLNYQPKSAPHFNPDRIVLTKGSFQTIQQHDFVRAICKIYPQAKIIERFDISHNRFELSSSTPLELHYKGKKTLVFGIHKSALRLSDEVIMPIIPVEGWQKIYASFIDNLLMSVPLERVTLGQICSYSAALKLTERKLGKRNPISSRLEKTKCNDGRVRFTFKLRIEVYRHLIDTIREFQPKLHISLCMEEYQTFKALNMESAIGYCNCVI